MTDALPALKVVDGPIHRAETFAEQFPPGFSQRYVYDLLTSVQGSVTLTVDEAGLVQIVPTEDADAATTAAGAGFDEAHRDKGVALLKDETSHAVEQHRPQIPDRAQLARLIWLKDSTGKYAWTTASDGAVVTDHWVGAATGGFTSPEALAKPVGALLDVAHAYGGGLEGLLNDSAFGTTIMIFVSAQRAGLAAGDASGYRGTGTRTVGMRRDWTKAREHMMKRGGPPVFAVPYDPIDGVDDPGAALGLKLTDKGGWKLVTCFPVAEPPENSRRLEDLP